MLKSEYVLNNDVCLIPRLYGMSLLRLGPLIFWGDCWPDSVRAEGRATG